MRILALVTDCFGGRGGIAQYNRDFMTALSLSPVVAEVIVLPRLGEEAGENIPAKVKQLPPEASRLRYALAAVEASWRRGPFDVIFCGHLFLAPLAVALAKVWRLPIWLQVHGIDAWERPTRLQKASFERAGLVTAVSRHTRRRVLGWSEIDPTRVRVLPNTFRFTMRPRDLEARVPDGFPFAGKPYLITVARINKEDAYKGHRRVLAVLGRLRQRDPDLQYVIVGEGDDRDSLEAEAAEADLANCVHFVGHAPTELLEKLLAAASAFVMPSTKEGFGIVFLEAAAHGLPIVAGNTDGSVDALVDGAIGNTVNPDDPDALFEAVSIALSGAAPPAEFLSLQRFCSENFRRHVATLSATFGGLRSGSSDLQGARVVRPI